MKRTLICYCFLLAAVCFLVGCGGEKVLSSTAEVSPTATESAPVEPSPTESVPVESASSASVSPETDAPEGSGAGSPGAIPEVTEEEIAAAINTASKFAWDWFYDNTHVDHSDVIMDDDAGGEWSYERVNEAGIQTVQDVIHLAEQYFTTEVAQEMAAYKQWMETDNGLYISATEGLGDPMVDSYKIQIQKDSETQYTLLVYTYYFGELMFDPLEVHYQYVNGNWVFDYPFACYFDVPVEIVELEGVG